MLQVYLVRHGETEWNALRRLQGQSDSALTINGERQANQVASRVQLLGITHVISSDLGRTRRTAAIIAKACGTRVHFDSRLRELNMGILETRAISTLTEKEKRWRNQLVNGKKNGEESIPGGESTKEVAIRMYAALNGCRNLPYDSKPLLVSHGMALECLINTVLGLPPYLNRRLRLRNCSISQIDYQEEPCLKTGWVVKISGDSSHLDPISHK